VPARVDGVWLSITALARREGAVVAVRHAVMACAEAFGAGAALSVAVDHRPYEPVFATDARSDELAELQATLGEGPSIDAGQGGGPVLGGDLAAPDVQARWPEFVPLALARGVAAVFAIPVGSGAARLGVLCLYRGQADALSPDQLDAMLLYADAVMMLALDDRGGLAPGAADLVGPSFSERRAEVHQATGMISVQLGISLTDALVTLRARAYADARPLSLVAADVVGRLVSFAADGAALPEVPEPGETGPAPQIDDPASRPRGPAPPGQGDQEQDREGRDEEVEGE
jgi:hypothetical protein